MVHMPTYIDENKNKGHKYFTVNRDFIESKNQKYDLEQVRCNI